MGLDVMWPAGSVFIRMQSAWAEGYIPLLPMWQPPLAVIRGNITPRIPFSTLLHLGVYSSYSGWSTIKWVQGKFLFPFPWKQHRLKDSRDGDECPSHPQLGGFGSNFAVDLTPKSEVPTTKFLYDDYLKLIWYLKTNFESGLIILKKVKLGACTRSWCTGPSAIMSCVASDPVMGKRPLPRNTRQIGHRVPTVHVNQTPIYRPVRIRRMKSWVGCAQIAQDSNPGPQIME